MHFVEVSQYHIRALSESNGGHSPVPQEGVLRRAEQHALFLLLWLLVALPLMAADTTWNGGTSATWSDDANWSGTAPSTSDTAVFSNAAPANQPNVADDSTILGLTLNVATTIDIDDRETLSLTDDNGTTGSGNLTLTGLGTFDFGSDGGNLSLGTGNIILDGFNPGHSSSRGFDFSDGDIRVPLDTSTGMPTGDHSLNNHIEVTANGGTIYLANSTYTESTILRNIDLGGHLLIESPGGGNSWGYSVAGNLKLLQDTTRTLRWGQGTNHNGTDWIAGPIIDGVGGANNPFRLDQTGRNLLIANANNTYAGGTIIEKASATSARYITVNSSGVLGTGDLLVERGGRLMFNNPTASATPGNLAAGANIEIEPGGVLSINADVDITDRLTPNSGGVYGLDTTITTPLNLSTMGNGHMFLGALSAGGYSAATLTPGANTTYRLGGGNPSHNFFENTGVFNLEINTANVLTGSANLTVASGLQTNASYGRVIMNASQDFVGEVLVNSDGMLSTAMTGGTPFGDLTNTITVYGSLSAVGASGTFNSAIFSKLVMKPGSTFYLSNLPKYGNSAGGNNGDRWDDAQDLVLDGVDFKLHSARNADSEESVGDFIFSGRVRLEVERNGTGGRDVVLTMASINRQNRGVLDVYTTDSTRMGGDDSNNARRFVFTDNFGLGIDNGMVPPWIADLDDKHFLQYDTGVGVNHPGTLGLKTITYTSSDLTTAGPTDIVSLNSSVTLTGAASCYALRFKNDINGEHEVTVTGGAIMAYGNNRSVYATLDSGSREMVYWSPSYQTFRNSAAIQTTGGFTKAEGSQLLLNNTDAGADYAITGGIYMQEGKLESGSRFVLALANNQLRVDHEGLLDINDENTTILGLSGSGRSATVYNDGGNPRTLTINLTSGTNTYDGRFQSTGDVGDLSLVKSGSGNQIMTSASRSYFTGTTVVSEGTLGVGGPSALYFGDNSQWTTAKFSVEAGATLALGVGGEDSFNEAQIALLSATGDGAGGFKNGSIIGFDTREATDNEATVDTAIANLNAGANEVGLDKIGSGNLTLTATHTFTGNTRVREGGLVMATSSGLSSDNVTVLPGASLGHDNTGSVALARNLHLDSGAGLTFPNSANALGKFSVGGNITLNANQITIKVGASVLTGGTYRLLEATGDLNVNGVLPSAVYTGAGISGCARLNVVSGAGGHVDLLVSDKPGSIFIFR